MDITIRTAKLHGSVTVPPSKSIAHRMLICAAFQTYPTTLYCAGTNEDIEATAQCLCALGANIMRTDAGYEILPAGPVPAHASLNCKESASTLRFLLPIAGALGIDATFHLEGRLSQRPLSPLWELMERKGCRLSRPTENTIRCTGRLVPGFYRIRGSVSSQFISGLMMAFPLIEAETNLLIKGEVASMPYILMTQYVLDWICEHHPRQITVEGDWSSAAFWYVANALDSSIAINGLNDTSPQGDAAVTELLPLFTGSPTLSARDIPDLIPILSVIAACKNGAVFTDVARLRLKESDRIAAIIAMLEAMGGKADATENTLTVYPATLTGGIVDSFGDHRIAMSAAIAATVCCAPVTILGAECVAKSYPNFWRDYELLGGQYDKFLR